MNLLRRLTRAIVMFSVIVAALCAIWYIWTYYERDPRTRNGHVRADVVGVTTDVSGLVTSVAVVADQRVRKGDLLFQVDTERFAIAVRQARANLESNEANLVYAQQQAARNRALRGLVAEQNVEQSDSTLRRSRAAVDQARAALASAQLDLDRSSVRASVNGIVSYADLRPGVYAAPGRGLLALVDLDSLRVEGYFQETRLRRVHVGDRAEVLLMGDDKPVYGHVTSITGAVNDSDTTIGGNLLPSINPNFAWVRLAQRIPVRIRLDPQYVTDALVPGRSATVLILAPDKRDAVPQAGAPRVADAAAARQAADASPRLPEHAPAAEPARRAASGATP